MTAERQFGQNTGDSRLWQLLARLDLEQVLYCSPLEGSSNIFLRRGRCFGTAGCP